MNLDRTHYKLSIEVVSARDAIHLSFYFPLKLQQA